MRAVVLTEAGTPLRVVDDHPDPADDGRGGEVIDVIGCGVCHSDIHVADGDFGGALPMILGHEVTGHHHQLGPVMVYAPWGCRSCRQCADGLEMRCADATEAGLFTDGGYAERMWVKNRRYLAPLDGLDPVAAAPLACGGLTAYRAVKHGLETLRSRSDGGRALVIGAGGLGQYALRYLRLQTDAHVTALDTAPDKRSAALEIGADDAVGPEGLDGTYDVVLDFIGADATLASAGSAVARGGLIVVIGLAGGGLEFRFGVTPHEARIMSSVWGSRSELDELLDFARREPEIVQPVEPVPLADAQVAHDRLRRGDVRGRFVLTP
ncbi:alcohol dehydrogenase catalytic domain-containing protein [Ilumatobacter sp.]|uniref:alcohol dehydrogenase catalytic domain-containing protein n=1 Tax=Ilumatobacter sp. TaxID=1967498 RepID=UPI003C3B675F